VEQEGKRKVRLATQEVGGRENRNCTEGNGKGLDEQDQKILTEFPARRVLYIVRTRPAAGPYAVLLAYREQKKFRQGDSEQKEAGRIPLGERSFSARSAVKLWGGGRVRLAMVHGLRFSLRACRVDFARKN